MSDLTDIVCPGGKKICQKWIDLVFECTIYQDSNNGSCLMPCNELNCEKVTLDGWQVSTYMKKLFGKLMQENYH